MRSYRVNATPEELMRRLSDVVHTRRVERVGEEEQLHFVDDRDGFKILLGAGGPDDPAAFVVGSLAERDGLLHLEVRSGLVGLRPDWARAAAREALPWALAILAVLVIGHLAGRLTVDSAIATISRWLALCLGLVSFRLLRRWARRRRDHAELLSVVESVAGPLVALPEAGPLRAPARCLAPEPGR